MKEQFFAYLSRMRYIGRWSLMRNALRKAGRSSAVSV